MNEKNTPLIVKERNCTENIERKGERREESGEEEPVGSAGGVCETNGAWTEEMRR